MKKVLIWVVALGIIGAAGYGVFRYVQAQQNPESVLEVLKSDTVVRGDLGISVTASGNVAVNERTELRTQLPGTVASVLVEVNQRVAEGEILAQIDTADLERTLRQTEIALELSQLSLDAAKEETDPEDIRVAELALSSAGKALQVAQLSSRVAVVDADAIKVQAQRAREQAFINLRDAREEGKNADRAETAYLESEAEERAAALNAQATLQQADSQLQAARTGYAQAERALQTLLEGPDAASVRQQEILLEQAQLRLEQIRRNLEDAALTAPHDGIVAEVTIEEGTYQSVGQRAFTLVDDATTYVDVTIDEIDIGAVEVGQSVEVTLDAYPDVAIGGLVETVAPASTNIGGLVAYQVRIILAKPDGDAATPAPRVQDGMTASVRIATDTIAGVLLVPSWALRIDQESAEVYTYVVVNGTPERRTVETGRRNDETTEVLSGLSDGESVALVLEQRVPFNFFAMGGPPGGRPGGF